MRFRMKLEGAEGLLQKLDRLEQKISQQVTKKAMKAGAKVLQSEQIRLAPEETGKSKAAIKVRSGKRRKNQLSIVSGVSDKWFVGDFFYFSFTDLGHKQGHRRLGGKRKQIPGAQSTEKAYDAKANAAVAAAIASYRQQLTAMKL